MCMLNTWHVKNIWKTFSTLSKEKVPYLYLGKYILFCNAHLYFCSFSSFFGRAFEKAADSTNSRTLHNHFDMSSE